MRHVEPTAAMPVRVVELTRRNLTALLEKLDDPCSARTLISPDGLVAVKAVEDAEHYTDRPPGPVYTNGELK